MRAHATWGDDPSGYCGCEDCNAPDSPPCPTRVPEPHGLGEFPMTCHRCHVEADS